MAYSRFKEIESGISVKFEHKKSLQTEEMTHSQRDQKRRIRNNDHELIPESLFDTKEMAHTQMKEINKLEHELHVCKRDIEAVDLNSLNQLPWENKLQKLSDYILLANNIVKAGINCLETAKVILPQPLKPVLHFLTKVIKIYFDKDVASIVIDRFDEIMSDELATRCRATCRRMTYCAIYVQSMPDTEDTSKIMSELEILAINFPLDKAFVEVLELGDRIQRMAREREFKKFRELAFYFQLYCTLTTYIELFLLQRIAVISNYGQDASPIKEILKHHRDYDEDVLKVLYRPTIKTVALHINCELDNSPNLKAFLTRRGLLPVCELDRYSRDGLDYCISPFMNPDKLVTHEESFFGQTRKLVLLNKIEAVIKGTHKFQFRKQMSADMLEQAYCIYVSCDQTRDSDFVRSGYVGRDSNDLIIAEADTHRWHVLKIFPESDSEKPAYMIWLVEDGSKKFLCLNWWNNVRLASFSQPVEKFLWDIHSPNVRIGHKLDMFTILSSLIRFFIFDRIPFTYKTRSKLELS